MWLGFETNEEKSERTPRQTIIYLRVQLNFNSLTLANVATRCEKLVAAESVTRRQLEAVVGLLNFAGPMLRLGKLFISPIIIWMNSRSSTSSRDSPIPVSASLREALLPFTEVKILETLISVG